MPTSATTAHRRVDYWKDSGYPGPMSSHRSFWQSVYERFDPEEPATSAAWRVARMYSPARDILQALARPFGDKRYLLFGTSGSGKSTELYALAEDRTRSGFVVVIDLRLHFQQCIPDPEALEHIEPWEVVLLAGTHLYRAAVQCLGYSWDSKEKAAFENAASRLLAGGVDTPPTVDIARLGSALAFFAGGAVGALAGPVGVAAGATASATGLQFLKAVADTGTWKVTLGRSKKTSLRDADDRVQALLEATNRLIEAISLRTGGQLTLVIDGLDRIKNEDTTRALMVESSLLSMLACPTLLAAPLSLRDRGLAIGVRGFSPKVLANCPVLDRTDPTNPSAFGSGVDFFVELWRRRIQGLDPALSASAIPVDTLRSLAWHSGGRARDFVRLIRNVAERAWDQELAVVGQDIIDDVIDERRRIVEMGLTRRHIDALEAVMTDPDHLLPKDDLVPELIDRFWLLPFPNESEWYHPHPLLTLHMLKRRG